ncbi:MAG: helix-turn-helix domain-containing protein [Ilumatobacter sp.]
MAAPGELDIEIDIDSDEPNLTIAERALEVEDKYAGQASPKTERGKAGKVKAARAYHSPLRESQARETRRRVVASARELFLERGYPTTTIAAVADRAGVSPDHLQQLRVEGRAPQRGP